MDGDGETSTAHIHVLEGDGWGAELCRSSSVFVLSTLRVRRSHAALGLPISIGVTRESVERILGPPWTERPDDWMVYRYPLSSSEYHSAAVEVTEGRVTQIEWSFGLDGANPCKRAGR